LLFKGFCCSFLLFFVGLLLFIHQAGAAAVRKDWYRYVMNDHGAAGCAAVRQAARVAAAVKAEADLEQQHAPVHDTAEECGILLAEVYKPAVALVLQEQEAVYKQVEQAAVPQALALHDVALAHDVLGPRLP
jgi:hypothetical protein